MQNRKTRVHNPIGFLLAVVPKCFSSISKSYDKNVLRAGNWSQNNRQRSKPKQNAGERARKRF